MEYPEYIRAPIAGISLRLMWEDCHRVSGVYQSPDSWDFFMLDVRGLSWSIRSISEPERNSCRIFLRIADLSLMFFFITSNFDDGEANK